MLNPPMIYDKAGLDFTAIHEGFRSKAYKDSGGVWTCGYGHTTGVGPSTICDETLARKWLLEDISIASRSVNRLVNVKLDQEEFNALVDFVYNVGVNAFATSTLLELLNKGDYSGAANQFLRWKFCKGVVVAGLLNRRNDEKKLFETPDKED